MTADIYLQRGRQKLRQWTANPVVRRWAGGAGWTAAGYLLSAASLAGGCQSLALGLVCVLTERQALAAALGAAAGYLRFWGDSGFQGVVWAVLGYLTALILGKRRITREVPLLIPALCSLFTSATGLAFQMLTWEDIPVGLYLTRVALGVCSPMVLRRVLDRADPIADWLAEGMAVLALAQTAPVPWLNPGFIAAGALVLAEPFPAAAAVGLALDLARVTPVPMTGVLCALYLTRLIPRIPGWVRRLMPGAVYLTVMWLCGCRHFAPLPGLVLGGLLSTLLPRRTGLAHRRGETGTAQVRLEVMAGVLARTQQLLLEAPEIPIDEEALLARTRERACGSCPNRRSCGLGPQIPRELLHRPVTENTSLPFFCRKPGRMALELRRTQEQYRRAKADREQRRECRSAVVQQYRFLSEFLRQQADLLPRRCSLPQPQFQPETGVRTRSHEPDNGDRVRQFQGPGCKFYLLLCDGMGTGLGAAQEACTAAELLREMLCAGFPAEHALRSLNSILALRGQAGAVTIDLAEIRLDTGRTSVYKWGAAPSWVLTPDGPEKIGTAGPPPGIDLRSARETVNRLSLRRGEMLILTSDGVEGEGFLHSLGIGPGEPPGEVAAKLLEIGGADSCDDATVAAVRLKRLPLDPS